MSARPDIARLRYRLSLRQPLDTPDTIGGFSRQWETLADVWALIEPAAVQPRLEAARQEARVTHRITIRWRPDITTGMCLVGEAGEFAIHGAHDADAQRMFMACYCEQVQS